MMDTSELVELSKTSSKEVLFDIILNERFSKEELVIFTDEVKSRGLEEEFADVTKNIELNKNKIKASRASLSEDDLFNIIVYNIDKFSEDDLILFKEEIQKRGLKKELNEKIKVKEAEDLKFKNKVLDPSGNQMELLDNFNQFMVDRHPNLAKEIKRKNKKASLSGIIFGVISLTLGIVLTSTSDGDIIFYGAILVGVILISKGLFNYLKT